MEFFIFILGAFILWKVFGTLEKVSHVIDYKKWGWNKVGKTENGSLLLEPKLPPPQGKHC